MTRAEALANARKMKAASRDVAGVPQFGAPLKKAPPVNELDKMWHFQLCVDYPESWFPVDKKTGKLNKAPYPKHYTIPNEGIAWDADYVDPNTNKKSPRARKWRYIEGQPSIWADEQPLLDSMDKAAIDTMLADNTLDFYYGQMHVRGIEKLKLDALQVQDLFEGKERQYQPKLRVYKLLNPAKQLETEMSLMDKQFNAERMARECDTERILECAFVMGIDITDQSDAGLARIRFEFLKKSKYDPQSPEGLDWFMDILNLTTVHPRYIFSMALQEGILSTSQQQNKLTWQASNSPIMEVNTNGDVADQLVRKFIDGDDLTIKLLHEVENQLYAVSEPD